MNLLPLLLLLAQSGPPQAMKVGDRAVLLGPVEVALREHVDYAAWSPDSRFLVGIRTPALEIDEAMLDGRAPAVLGPQRIAYWSRDTHELHELQPLAEGAQVRDLGWPSRPGAVLIHVERPDSAEGMVQHALIWADLATRQSRTFVAFRATSEAFVRFVASPTEPWVIGLAGSMEKLEATTYDLSGRIVASRELDHGTSFGYSSFWTDDGRGLGGAVDGDRNQVRVLDAATLRESVRDQPLRSLLRNPDTHGLMIEATRVRAELREPEAHAEHPVAWLKSDKGALALGAGVDRAELSPDGRWVSLFRDGAVAVRRLIWLEASAYAALEQTAERTRAMSNAKQIGLALIMYAVDHDEQLPGKDYLNDLMPYLRERAVFAMGFTFLATGGHMGRIDKPAETPLGFVQAAGGFAVVFADGHVGWSDRPPGT